jgi:hypothetical protein
MLRPNPEFKTRFYNGLPWLANRAIKSIPESIDHLTRKIDWERELVYSKCLEWGNLYSMSVFYDFGDNEDLRKDDIFGKYRFFSARDHELEPYWNKDCKAWVEITLQVTNKRKLIHRFNVEVLDTIAETHLNAWKYLGEICKNLLIKN